MISMWPRGFAATIDRSQLAIRLFKELRPFIQPGFYASSIVVYALTVISQQEFEFVGKLCLNRGSNLNVEMEAFVLTVTHLYRDNVDTISLTYSEN